MGLNTYYSNTLNSAESQTIVLSRVAIKLGPNHRRGIKT